MWPARSVIVPTVADGGGGFNHAFSARHISISLPGNHHAAIHKPGGIGGVFADCRRELPHMRACLERPITVLSAVITVPEFGAASDERANRGHHAEGGE